MEYKNDLNEIVELINAGIIEPSYSQHDSHPCLQRMTMPIDDEFLMSRANIIHAAWKDDLAFRNSITKLSCICNDVSCPCNTCPVNKYCNSYIYNAQNSIPDSSPKIIDLFCGAGGLSLGFIQEGYSSCMAET